jgi:hypothetical protein
VPVQYQTIASERVRIFRFHVFDGEDREPAWCRTRGELSLQGFSVALPPLAECSAATLQRLVFVPAGGLFRITTPTVRTIHCIETPLSTCAKSSPPGTFRYRGFPCRGAAFHAPISHVRHPKHSRGAVSILSEHLWSNSPDHFRDPCQGLRFR